MSWVWIASKIGLLLAARWGFNRRSLQLRHKLIIYQFLHHITRKAIYILLFHRHHLRKSYSSLVDLTPRSWWVSYRLWMLEASAWYQTWLVLCQIHNDIRWIRGGYLSTTISFTTNMRILHLVWVQTSLQSRIIRLQPTTSGAQVRTCIHAIGSKRWDSLSPANHQTPLPD